MHSFWSALSKVALAISCCGGSPAVAQTDGGVSDALKARSIEIDHSVAKFTISVSPPTAAVGEEVTLSVRVTMDEGWHIGAMETGSQSFGFPTRIRFLPVGLEAVEETFTASTPAKELKLDVGTQMVMEGEFSWTRKYRVAAMDAAFSGTGDIRFQACNDTKCLPPKTLKFSLGDGASTESPETKKAGNEATDAAKANDEKTVGPPLQLSLEPCELTRTRPQIGNILSLLLMGRASERMVWKATISSGPHKGVSLYIPKSRQYSLQNTSDEDTIVGNTATYVSVDQNGDGVLADWEAAALNRPVRIHDTMYRVTELSIENKTLTLQQLDAPLKGSLVGFRCPDFEYTTLDGSVVSNKTIVGKTTVLDIWAVTCHNCYEGFPRIQRALDKHTPEKLSVILLTVDNDRKFYDSLAPRLFETYGGGSWPQVMIPGGFNGAVTIGDYGFGSVVVDAAGIVRAVGVLGFGIEGAVDEAIKHSAENKPQ